jgi:hypothetical protein
MGKKKFVYYIRRKFSSGNYDYPTLCGTKESFKKCCEIEIDQLIRSHEDYEGFIDSAKFKVEIGIIKDTTGLYNGKEI